MASYFFETVRPGLALAVWAGSDTLIFANAEVQFNGGSLVTPMMLGGIDTVLARDAMVIDNLPRLSRGAVHSEAHCELQHFREFQAPQQQRQPRIWRRDSIASRHR